MSLDAPVCQSFRFPSHPHRKGPLLPMPSARLSHPSTQRPAASQPLCSPSYSLSLTTPVLPASPPRPAPGPTAYPGLQLSVCGTAGHAGSGCPQRYRCRCAAFLPRVGASGSRAGCWLLACSVCSCSTWNQRTAPVTGLRGARATPLRYLCSGVWVPGAQGVPVCNPARHGRLSFLYLSAPGPRRKRREGREAPRAWCVRPVFNKCPWDEWCTDACLPRSSTFPSLPF